MKRIWLTAIAAGLLAMAAFAPVAAQDIITLQLDEVDGSGITGNASISEEGGQAIVSILIVAGLEEDAVHPVHIHEGSCDDLGGVAFPLDDIVDGVSETTLEVSLADLQTGEYAINAHLSADEMSTYIMCANIPAREAADDEVAEEDDAAAEEDDAVADDEDAVAEDDEEADDAEDVLPATGSIGSNPETAIMTITLLAGLAMGAGVLIRRRAQRA